jgi:hypothetical protein
MLPQLKHGLTRDEILVKRILQYALKRQVACARDKQVAAAYRGRNGYSHKHVRHVAARAKVKDNLAHQKDQPSPLSRKRQDSLYTQLYCMAELNQLDTWLAELQASTCLNKNFSNTLLQRPGQKAAQQEDQQHKNLWHNIAATKEVSSVRSSQHPQSCTCMNLHSQGGGTTRTAVRLKKLDTPTHSCLQQRQSSPKLRFMGSTT